MIRVIAVTNQDTGKPIHRVELPEDASFEHQMVAFLDATRLVLTHAAQGRSMVLTIEAEKRSVQ
jgi:hypothetical protein